MFSNFVISRLTQQAGFDKEEGKEGLTKNPVVISLILQSSEKQDNKGFTCGVFEGSSPSARAK